jgi:hypothetical protein
MQQGSFKLNFPHTMPQVVWLAPRTCVYFVLKFWNGDWFIVTRIHDHCSLIILIIKLHVFRVESGLVFQVEVFWVVVGCQSFGGLNMGLWNVGILPEHYMAPQPTRPRLETSLHWKPQNWPNLVAVFWLLWQFYVVYLHTSCEHPGSFPRLFEY